MRRTRTSFFAVASIMYCENTLLIPPAQVHDVHVGIKVILLQQPRNTCHALSHMRLPPQTRKRLKQVSVVRQPRKQGIALPLYNDEPRVENPRLRATGLSEHAVTRNPTGSRKHQRLKTAIATAGSRERHAVSPIGTKKDPETWHMCDPWILWFHSLIVSWDGQHVTVVIDKGCSPLLTDNRGSLYIQF